MSYTIIIGILVLLFLSVIIIYNSLVRRRNRVREAWADIDVQLKRRHNLIPNLVEAVKGYMQHERGVLENVTKARTEALSAKNPAEREKKENMLTDTLKTLFAVSENYPDLKASANFLDLQREVADAENKIQAARRFYNSNVRDYNTAIQSFPTNLLAGTFKFKEEALFKVEIEKEREMPKIQF